MLSSPIISNSIDQTISLVTGSRDEQFTSLTLGRLAEQQAKLYGDREAVIFPWQGARFTYTQLFKRSETIARSLLAEGLKPGDHVGIYAGNCYQYIEMFLGAGRIGCPFVILNSTYSPQELLNAVIVSRCKFLVMATSIGSKNHLDHIQLICDRTTQLQNLVLLTSDLPKSSCSTGLRINTYDSFVSMGISDPSTHSQLKELEAAVSCESVVNLQFTSGTTGSPKAAMLTHHNIINNGRFLGDRMKLDVNSIVCCPPPLFHCFGIVIGFLGAFTHGGSIVYPSVNFDASAVLDSITAEKCSSILGVPTMFTAVMELNRKKKLPITTLKSALVSGSPVPWTIMNMMDKEMGIKDTFIAYGMTETSPVTFMTSLTDSLECRLKTVGTVLPHTSAKIVDAQGNVVPRGVRGEICTSGYALQKGYFENESKTKEVMKFDENGVLWMHTGDEGIIDEAGYCSITGRIKDIIIRGGENIFPPEIEECLLTHPSIEEASVVGLPDERYGEVVACFIRQRETTTRPSTLEIAEWVRSALGRHKAPKHVLWVGDSGIGNEIPKTGSGKHQKYILRAIGQRIIQPELLKSKL